MLHMKDLQNHLLGFWYKKMIIEFNDTGKKIVIPFTLSSPSLKLSRAFLKDPLVKKRVFDPIASAWS